MSKTLHVIVSGSRPAKVNGRYVDFATENALFVANTLDKGLSSDTNVHLYHGAAAGVDQAADDWAHARLLTGSNLRLHQFPAIWQVWNNATRKFETNRFAGPQRNHAMIESALTAAYGKDDHQVIMLAFYATPNLSDSTGTADAVAKAEYKKIPVRTFQLPVLNASAEAAANPTPFDS
jgi:hypothetical protein